MNEGTKKPSAVRARLQGSRSRPGRKALAALEAKVERLERQASLAARGYGVQGDALDELARRLDALERSHVIADMYSRSLEALLVSRGVFALEDIRNQCASDAQRLIAEKKAREKAAAEAEALIESANDIAGEIEAATEGLA